MYGVCRDLKRTLAHCRPWAGDVAGVEDEIRSPDVSAADVDAEVEAAGEDVHVAPLDNNDSAPNSAAILLVW